MVTSQPWCVSACGCSGGEEEVKKPNKIGENECASLKSLAVSNFAAQESQK